MNYLSLFFLMMYYAVYLYMFILFIFIIISWLPNARELTIYRFLYQLAQPFMRYFSGWAVIGMMDFTPMVGFIFLQLVGRGFLSLAVFVS